MDATPEDIRKAARKLFWAANSMEKGDTRPLDNNTKALVYILAIILFPDVEERERRHKSESESAFWDALEEYVCRRVLRKEPTLNDRVNLIVSIADAIENTGVLLPVQKTPEA